MKLTLTQGELDILLNAAISENQQVLVKGNPLPNGKVMVEGDEEAFSTLRECCGEYLLVVGFDQDYNLTPEGKTLEDLIDKFYFELEKNEKYSQGA